MYDVPERLTSASAASVDAFATLASTAFGGAERLVALNLNAARTMMEESAASARALLEVKDVPGLVSLQTMRLQPGLEKAGAYSRTVYRIATDTKEALSEVVEGQVCELGHSANQALDDAASGAPAGSDLAVNAIRSALSTANSTYLSMTKTAKQVSDLAEAALAAAIVAKPSRKTV